MGSLVSPAPGLLREEAAAQTLELKPAAARAALEDRDPREAGRFLSSPHPQPRSWDCALRACGTQQFHPWAGPMGTDIFFFFF